MTPGKKKPVKWVCSRCNTTNSGIDTNCMYCQAPNPDNDEAY